MKGIRGLPKRISILRVRHNLTQRQLAQRVNVSQNQISRWENGIRPPDLHALRALAQVFRVTPEILQQGEPEAWYQ